MMPTMPVAQVLACIYCGSQLCSTACYPTHKDQYTCHVWRCPGRNPVEVALGQLPSAATSHHDAVQAQGRGTSRPAAPGTYYTNVPTTTTTLTYNNNYLPTNPQFEVSPPARHSVVADTFRGGPHEHSPYQGMWVACVKWDGMGGRGLRLNEIGSEKRNTLPSLTVRYAS